MARASLKLGQDAQAPKLAAAPWQSGPYQFQIYSDTFGSKLTVSSGDQSATADIAWIFGAGVRGKTYILKNKDRLYESQVSTFTSLQGLATTPGHSEIKSGDLKDALGEHLSTAAAARCFGCHTTYSSTNSNFDLSHVIPGVRCEACHGPGVNHIKAIKQANVKQAAKAILNPAHMSPADSVDFCGACHRTTMDIAMTPQAHAAVNVRFQPYRLERSKCWGTQGDRRLTCIACHNPHRPLVKEASFYDQRCLSCHASQGAAQAGMAQSHNVCPKATANCTNCHMPKYDVPEMHAPFTDHFIRVVRIGEPYPY